MEPKQLPVSASLGAMGSLAGKLDALQDADLQVKIWKLTNWLLLLSKEPDPTVAARIWMKDVRELSYDMENCVDVSELDWIGSMPGFKARVEVAIERYHRYKLGSTHNFTNTATNFKIPVVDGQRRPDLAVVGLHDEGGAVDTLIQLLTDDCKTEPKVVSIVGVGGIGKTTLAKELWREAKKLGAFNCRAFVRTAKKADMGRILRSILAQVRPQQPPDTDEVHELIHDIKTHLQGKRYFIIIDDVWATSVWDVARRAFPESNGSKIITTTEIKDVSLACCSYQCENIFKMKPLSISQSQQLFISGVFGSGEEKSRQFDGVSGEIITEEKSLQLGEGPEEIVIEEKSHKLDEVSEEIIIEEKSHKLDEVSEEIIIEEKSRNFDKMSDEIITRCAGLPLAIISISSVLASQREANTIHNWMKVENDSPINTTPVEILKQVLNFCYNCLPSNLQTCLLYLSVYPENYMILKEDIMKQWVAQGFIVAPTENDKMKVAGNYFDKLVSMGLIQHIDVGYSNEVHYYAVHHMVHDLITLKSKEENFTTVIDYSERTVGISNKVSRLSLQFGSATYATIPKSIGLSQVRSLAFIGLKSCYSSILEFKVLRFLILHMWVDQPRTGLDLKPTSELVVLKSLQVTCNDTVHLPDLMQGPKQLETLEINARVAVIPAKIVHLRSWLHLRLGVGTELTDLTGILRNDTLKPSVALDGSSSPPNSVTTLELLSPICGVPKWIGQLTNLCILKFVLGELQCDDIHNLQGLPLLTVLSLDVQRPTTGPIGFAPGLFNALEYFEFRCGVLRLAFEKGAMRNLQRLRLGFNAHRGEQYDDWLHGIEHLSNVKEISGIIGLGTGADQRDLDNAQSTFLKAIGKHGRRIVTLKRADMVEELYSPAEKQPSTSSSQRVGSPKLESQEVHGPLETQHEIPEKKPTTSNGQHGSPTQESPDVCGPPEKQHEISEEEPSTPSEQPARTNQDYQKEIKQDSGSDYQFINRMPSPGAPSKNMYSKPQQPAATPHKNEFTSKKERSITDLVVGMAKAVVDGALTKAQAAIAEEAKLRQRAQRNLVFITDEFQMMQSCLKNIAGSERLENPVVRTWVWQIRELAYNVEDCIEFVGHLDKKNRWWLRLLKPMNLLTPCIHVALPLDVAVDELDQLKARVQEVSSRNARYSLISSQSAGFKPVAAEAQPASQSHDSVGMTALNRLIEAANTNKEEIIHLLPKKDQDLGVISIWGTGGGDVGLGIASIAWNAFTDDHTCQNFVCRAWVKLMYPFDPREFVQSLTAQFYANSYYKEGRMMSVDGVHALMKMEEATRGGDPLKDFERLVMENRYLVVLEDLSTVADWAAIRRFFPNMKNGSCVILSTKQFEVASLSVGRPFKVLHLNELQAEHSVYAFFTEGSWYDGDKGMERNSGVSSGNCKKEAAKRWIDQHPLVGRELEMKDLGLKVIVARAKGYQVMSVWGFAGVGKSALVKNMFCEKVLKGKLFQKYGWVDVPHPFNLRDFSQTLLWNFGSEYLQDSERAASLCSMGSRNPIAECRQILKQQRCLVVIDALQSKEDWDLIKDGLVYGSHRQNVIIVVTTEQEIATHCRGDKGEPLVFNVKGLEANTAIELFEKVSNKGEVAEIRELTSICGGLPKVIVEIAGSFAKNTDRWKDAPSTNNNFMLELENNGEFVGLRGLFDWMNSSFRNCPDSLKACILYLPVFPRNYLIRRRRLIRRWIAEGYSRDNHEESAEMTGEKQFQDLLDLRIIQQPSMLGLGDTRCQVNGFFREYIVSHQTEEALVFELTGSCVVSTQRTGRHLVISETWVREQTVFKNIDFSRLRSLTVFGKWESFFISESMKLLRVLDLEDASEVKYSDLKKTVKLLCRLKFLSLRGCHDIHHLPSSIDNLRQLQSLDVRHTSIVTLPRNITKLQKLQYIRAGTSAPANSSLTKHHLLSRLSSRHLVGIVVPPGIGKLTALQRLSVVNVNASGTKAVLEELKKLSQLRKLGVSGINKNNSNKFFLALSDTVHLESLSVRLEVNNQACLDDIPLPLRIKSLQSLKLYGLGDRLPNWKAQLTMLTKMDLEIAKLTEDHVSAQSESTAHHAHKDGFGSPRMRKPTIGVIKFLSELPGLCILRLHVHHLQDNQLDVSIITNDLEEDSFEKMKIFEIACSSSSKITFGEKTMKKLEQLKVDCCRGSSLLGLKHLPELKEVLLKGSSDEALKADLIKELENHPKQKRPVVKLEELPSSS